MRKSDPLPGQARVPALRLHLTPRLPQPTARTFPRLSGTASRERAPMPKQRCLWTCLSFFAAVQPALWAPLPVRAGTPAPTGTGVVKDAQALTEAIDQHMAGRWAAEGVKPADRADDAEFMRRVYLDLAGKIPPVSEV